MSGAIVLGITSKPYRHKSTFASSLQCPELHLVLFKSKWISLQLLVNNGRLLTGNKTRTVFSLSFFYGDQVKNGDI
jgi:hypothetical protein